MPNISNVHDNSIVSYHRFDFGEREQKVLTAYHYYKKPLTDRKVAIALGFNDMNSVRPIITGLIKKNILCEVDNVMDYGTNRKVRRCYFCNVNIDFLKDEANEIHKLV